MRLWPFKIRIDHILIAEKEPAWKVERWWGNGLYGSVIDKSLRKAWSMRPKKGVAKRPGDWIDLRLEGDTSKAIEFGKSLLKAHKAASDFERSMQLVSDAVNTTAEDMERMKEKVVNKAIDNEVMELWRKQRIAEGKTDHKKLLKQESLPRNIARMTRAVAKSGYEIGWLRGVRWSFPWWSPPSCVPYDWAIDGLPHPSAKTDIVNVVIRGHFGAGLWKCKAPGCLASAIGNDHCKIHQGSSQ